MTPNYLCEIPLGHYPSHFILLYVRIRMLQLPEINVVGPSSGRFERLPCLAHPLTFIFLLYRLIKPLKRILQTLFPKGVILLLDWWLQEGWAGLVLIRIVDWASTWKGLARSGRGGHDKRRTLFRSCSLCWRKLSAPWIETLSWRLVPLEELLPLVSDKPSNCICFSIIVRPV